MKPKFIIIGDSFAMPSRDSEDSFYAKILEERYPQIDFLVNGDPSRDVQTIVDNWIKVIPDLEPTDYLIVVIPTFVRTRLPLSQEICNISKLDKIKIANRFKGTDSYAGEELEIFGSNMTRKELGKMFGPQLAVNGSDAFEMNMIEVIESLIKITKSKIYVFSWDYLDKTNPSFDDRKGVTKKLGKWKTLGTEFISTNGKSGVEGDIHWSYEMHLAFADFIENFYNLKS